MTLALHPPAATAKDGGSTTATTARRHRIDVVSALTVYLVIAFCVPAPLIVGPIGAAGTPANLIGVLFLVWWCVAKLGTGLGIARGHQPVRLALLCFLLPVLTSMVALYARPYVEKEGLGALRALLYVAALLGIALLAADGITSVDRVHVLMRRVVHGTAFVASIGIVQYLTDYNPAGQLSIPGLVRNSLVENQDRSIFLRIQSTTIHPIELGALMGVMLPLALHYAVHARDRRGKWISWIEVLLIAIVLPMALSRTGTIAALIGLIALAMEWTWAQRAKLIGFGIAFLCAMRLAIPGLLGTLSALFLKINEDNSTLARVQRYKIAGHYFQQNPWWGRGASTLYPATKQIFDNAYLYQAIEQGAVGLVGIFLFFFILIFTARGARRRTSDPLTRGVAQVMAGTFVSVMIIFATADLGGFPMLMGEVFLMAGVTGALWRLNGADRPREVSPA